MHWKIRSGLGVVVVALLAVSVWVIVYFRGRGADESAITRELAPEEDDGVPEEKADKIGDRIHVIGKESVDELFAQLDDRWPIYQVPAILSAADPIYAVSEVGILLAHRRLQRLRQILREDKDRASARCLMEFEKKWKRYQGHVDRRLRRYEQAEDPSKVTAIGLPDPLMLKSAVNAAMFLTAEFCSAEHVIDELQAIEAAARQMEKRIFSNDKFPDPVRGLLPMNFPPQPTVLLTVLTYAVERDSSLQQATKDRYRARLNELDSAEVTYSFQQSLVPWDEFPAWFDRPSSVYAKRRMSVTHPPTYFLTIFVNGSGESMQFLKLHRLFRYS